VIVLKIGMIRSYKIYWRGEEGHWTRV